MSDLTDLYREVILDHNKRPRNAGRLAHPTHHADGYNPLCGDRLALDLEIADGRIVGVAFQGSGCAISQASASLMTDAIKGATVAEADTLFDRVRVVLTTPIDREVDLDAIGKIAVIAGVREFPARVKCASLAWHTLRAAIKSSDAPAKTE